MANDRDELMRLAAEYDGLAGAADMSGKTAERNAWRRAASDLRALAQRAPQHGAAPEGWRCFHCSEEFTDRDAAALHFGTHEYQEPACQIDIAKYREMEAMQRRYLDEDADVHRAMRRMETEHQQALRRAEEDGYAKGLADAVKYPQDAAPAPESAKCVCGVSTCVEPWEPGCGLGNSEEFVVAAPEAERARGEAVAWAQDTPYGRAYNFADELGKAFPWLLSSPPPAGQPEGVEALATEQATITLPDALNPTEWRFDRDDLREFARRLASAQRAGKDGA